MSKAGRNQICPGQHRRHPSGRLAYHVQGKTASVCHFTYLMRVMPPDELASLADDFEERQSHLFSQSSDVFLKARSLSRWLCPFDMVALASRLSLSYLIWRIPYIPRDEVTSSLLDTAEVWARWTSNY